MEKIINSRVTHKHDFEANWIKAVNFIPKAGEMIIYDAEDADSPLPESRAEPITYVRLKFGDGHKYVNELEFERGVGQQTLEGGEIFCDYENNSARLNGHAEGEYTSAGWRSHAEGYLTNASASTSHTEGRLTQATGKCAHAEGIEFNTDFSDYQGKIYLQETVDIESNTITIAPVPRGLEINSAIYLTNGTNSTQITPTDAKIIKEVIINSQEYATYTIIDLPDAGEEGPTGPISGVNLQPGYLETTGQIPTRDIGGGEYILTADAISFANDPTQTKYGIKNFYQSEIADGTNSISFYGDYTPSVGEEFTAYTNVIATLTLHSPFKANNYTEEQTPNGEIPSGALVRRAIRTTASGEASHAEGMGTQASGYVAHSEGYYTKATGQASHAEGSSTQATGNSSHTEGSNTISLGTGAHAEGIGAKSTGSSAHSEGNSTHAYSDATHTEGYNTKAGNFIYNQNTNTYDIGGDTGVASTAHAEGHSTMAIATGAHAEGRNTIAAGNASHAEGSNTIASGSYSHAGGLGTKAIGNAQTVIGKYNRQRDNALFIIGNGESSDSPKNIVEVFSNSVNISDIYNEAYNSIKPNEVQISVGGIPDTVTLSPTELTFYSSNYEEYIGTINVANINADNINTNSINLGHITAIDADEVMTDSLFVNEVEINPNNFVGQKTSKGGEIFNSYAKNSATSTNAHAEGFSTIASGSASHAEGNTTWARSDATHAEGYNTKAGHFVLDSAGKYIDGGTATTSSTAHAEGHTTVACGTGAHAEGRVTVASGNASHAEGMESIANGAYAHAEGYKTKANGSAQHVQGKYNIGDTMNVYAHIVGNGINTPSNAHTLDWSGNAWFAGDVYVNSTSGINKDEGSKKLATEEFVLNNSSSVQICIHRWEEDD